jgi:hypothetical protein
MLVREAKAAARQWVMERGCRTPAFAGAYLAGSVTWIADDVEFPVTSDLDVNIVVEGPGAVPTPRKFVFRGVLLEVSYLARDVLHPPEAVLGNGQLAGAFRTPGVILDPTGALTTLQEVVSREYARRQWVRARCEHAASRVLGIAQSLAETAPLHDQVTSCAFAAGVTTHVLLAAGLRNLTVRRRYAAVRELLAAYGRLDFHEPLLELLGCAGMDRARVEQHLAAVTVAFDAARAAIRTPYRFGSDLSDVARPVAIDGSRELIERGLHREAVFWLVATFSRCRHVFAADAPELLTRFDPSYRALLADLGVGSFADRSQRCREVEAFLPRLREVTEEVLAANGEIRD